LQAEAEALGATIVVLVEVAPKVTTLVVVAKPSLNLVFVGVGSVVVLVRRPERTVGGEIVVVVDAVNRMVSVVVIAAAGIVAVAVMGVL